MLQHLKRQILLGLWSQDIHEASFQRAAHGYARRPTFDALHQPPSNGRYFHPKLGDNQALLYASEGLRHQAKGNYADAIDDYRRALALDPQCGEAWNDLATAVMELGALPLARTAAARAMRAVPCGRHAYNWAQLTSFRSEKAPLAETGLPGARSSDVALDREIGEMVGILRRAVSEEDAIHCHFALAKAYDDAELPEFAMSHLKAGNLLRRARLRYREAETLSLMEEMTALFDRPLFFTPSFASAPSNRGEGMVFLIGLPRTGSTLTEQILCGHGDFASIGESSLFHDLAHPLLADALARLRNGDSPAATHRAVFTAERLAALGAAYEQKAHRLAPGAALIINKMPNNAFYAGLIRLALPAARMVALRRDPRDVAISCFSKLFSGNQPFTYNLAELGRYMRVHGAMMDHWRAILGDNQFMTLDYEMLVSDFTDQVTRLLNFCGRDWDPACRQFATVANPVRTASAVQVRGALSQRSIGRWRLYSHWLEEFILNFNGTPPGASESQRQNRQAAE